MYRIIESSDERAVERLIDRRSSRERSVERRAAAIVSAVRRRGDAALRQYAGRLDGVTGPVELSAREVKAGAARTPPAVRRAIASAAEAIRSVAERQLPPARTVVVTAPGVSIELRRIPLARVGCYVPGGRFPLMSSLLMTAIPAAAAGVGEIVAVCPRVVPGVLAAAVEAGVGRMFRIGGAHAVAALAYGTNAVPRVDKIVGPGNAWVAAAKRLVAVDCAIDFHAGPTELVIIARGFKGSKGSRGSRGSKGSQGSRGSLQARWIAADLVAQAEHDPEARSILITPSRALAAEVARAVRQLAPAVAAEALARNGGAVVTRDLHEAVDVAERIAPEHLACDDERVAERVRNAGTVFVGRWAAPAAGDYATGSNHVLPTGGAARARAGLSAADFVKIVAVQRLTRAGLRAIAAPAMALAGAEGLLAHARSLEIRLRAPSISGHRRRPTRSGCTSTSAATAAPSARWRRFDRCRPPTSAATRTTAPRSMRRRGISPCPHRSSC